MNTLMYVMDILSLIVIGACIYGFINIARYCYRYKRITWDNWFGLTIPVIVALCLVSGLLKNYLIK